ncbi:MAG: SusD/RagB family nutrient-binding outer membrane lipoprotein [Alphaproteobacteria bacterium]|nr:SusD/RagB family nutrient-binding outer membrane lipoprotein [Alphaproteobacteria bacterium]
MNCKKNISEINLNPNATTSINAIYLFTTGQLQIGGEYENTRIVGLYVSPMIQHTASTSYAVFGDKYQNNGGSGAYMESHYTGVVKLLSNAIALSNDDPKQNYTNAIATILRVFDLHRMTDIYGDIPYTQAGYGLQDSKNWFPIYENQKDIYSYMVNDLKAARDKLKTSAIPIIAKQDFIYNGDVSKWIKLANALLMRIAMRMSSVAPDSAKYIFIEANASGTFVSNFDNATIKYGPSGVNNNGLSDGYAGSRKYAFYNDIRISKTFMDWMKNNNDPRISIISGGTVVDTTKIPSTLSTEQIGLPNGYTDQSIRTVLPQNVLNIFKVEDIKYNAFAVMNPKYLDWEDPYLLITYSEIEFMRAEAAIKSWITTDPNTHFTNGVTAAIQNWIAFDPSFAVADTAITSYLNRRAFNLVSNTDKLRLIGEEYWAATFLNDIESWCNWRRTGYPILKPTQDINAAEKPNAIPRRLRYWDYEITANPEHINAAIKRMGADMFVTRVWWDGGK